MKLITEIEDDKLFLATLYNCVPVIEQALKETEVMKIVRTKPAGIVIPGEGLTKEQTEEIEKSNDEKIKAQFRKNMIEACRQMMIVKPECTIEIFRSMVVLEETDKDYPHGVRLALAMAKVLTNKDLIDFFAELMRSGLVFADVL